MRWMPPLCPKTMDEFRQAMGVLYLVTAESDCSQFDTEYGFNRRILARYQACAWMDRSVRWEKVLAKRGSMFMFNTGIKHPLWFPASLAKTMCDICVRQWREWEEDIGGATAGSSSGRLTPEGGNPRGQRE
jgi:hypothetical protein